MSNHQECGGDAAAYTLGALDADEARAFQAHMEACVVCRDEVAALRVVVDSLPVSAPRLAPPTDLKRRVMSEVRADARAAGRSGSRRWSRVGAPAWLPRPALGATALALTAVLALALVELVPGGTNARALQAAVAWRPGSAVLRIDSGRSELIVRRMPQPPAGRVYEVWLERGAQTPSPTSALFDVDSSGAATVEVPGSLHGVDRVLVTAERSGGSAVPTRQPVIVARLS